MGRPNKQDRVGGRAGHFNMCAEIITCVSPLVCLCFSSGVFLSYSVTGACPVTTNLVVRVDAKNDNHSSNNNNNNNNNDLDNLQLAWI